ncbi:MAG: phasin family protein [Comamonadaceae bacterium]|nr:phasin family protein [Comamonadaceae bacterium]
MLQRNKSGCGRTEPPTVIKEISMNATHEKLAGLATANIETALAIARTAFAGTERLAALNINTARSVVDESYESAKMLMAVKDPKELATLNAAMAKPAVEKGIAYSRAVYSILSETSEELSKLSGGRMNALKADFETALETAAKVAPAGSEPAVAAFRSALDAANNAYDTMSKAARQVGEIAEANANVAADTAVKALESVAAAPKAKKAA